ncbi:MAG TPA: folylpolyglutamate synthase/dihydrofolate synthase family protein [Jiangellaceae bacterium]|nr:folylpolyglutamate synthase/dihydrofolate synthase family protein [Jiangellaceae bacterium]
MSRADDELDPLAQAEILLRSRWPENIIEPSLERITALLGLLGDPQRNAPVIHVAGTNGKSSTVRMIDSLLREMGLRTGRYTSPHLESITERIVIDGEAISGSDFADTYAEIAPYLDIVDAQHDVPLSFFEVLTAMAYVAFADAPVEVAVIETGLGGSWDATNVADGDVAVVTPVALDHADYLGDALEEIAGEKAGIIKPGSIAVLARQEPEVAEVLLQRVADVGATVVREGPEFAVRRRDVAVGGQLLDLQGLAGQYSEILVSLHGEHQAANAATALAAVEAFIGGGGESLDQESVRSAFSGVGAPGRVEVLRRGPTILVDAAHNPAGAKALTETLTSEFTFTRLVGVMAMMGDKDARGILEELEPVLAHVVLTRNSSPRSLPVEELADVAAGIFGRDRVSTEAQLPDAIDAAVAVAEEEGLLGGAGVLVTGSVVTAGDARTLLGGAT